MVRCSLLPCPARECATYNRNQVWFKKKKKEEGESFPKHIYIQYAHVMCSFLHLQKGSQESPWRRRSRMQQVSGWGSLKCTCSLHWTPARGAVLKSVFLLEVKVRAWEVCGLQQEMEITFTSVLCQVLLNLPALTATPCHCTDGNMVKRYLP